MEYKYFYNIDDAVVGFNEEMDPKFYNYVKLTDEQVAFWKQYDCSASEAIAMYVKPIDIQELKNDKLQYVKQKAEWTLRKTDYKVIRHYEQTLLGVEPTLSQIEFQTVMADRQAVRDYSNYLEQQVKSANTAEQVQNIIWNLE